MLNHRNGVVENGEHCGKFWAIPNDSTFDFHFCLERLKWVQDGDGWLKVKGTSRIYYFFKLQIKFKEQKMLRASGYLRTTCRLFRLASAPSIYCSLRGCGCHGSQVLCLSPAKSYCAMKKGGTKRMRIRLRNTKPQEWWCCKCSLGILCFSKLGLSLLVYTWCMSDILS